MSLGLSSIMAPVGAPRALFAAASNISARGMRDNLQALAMATASLEDLNDGLLFQSISETKPTFEAFFDAARRIPGQCLNKQTIGELRKAYRLALQGNEGAQRILKPTIKRLASSVFSHRPLWLVTDETREQIGPVAARYKQWPENDRLFSYQVRSEGRAIKTEEEDPWRLTIDGLHVSTETVLLKRTHRLVLVPGPSGVGKSGHMIPHLQRQFAKQLGPDEVLVIDAIDVRDETNQPNELDEFIRKVSNADTGHAKLPLVTIIDNTPVIASQPEYQRRFAWSVLNYLQGDSNRSIILFGGTVLTIEGQMRVMGNLLAKVIKSKKFCDRWAYLPVQLQPLNILQQQQVLAPQGTDRTRDTGGQEDSRSKTSVVNKLSPEECRIYTDEVSIRTAPFLPSLRPFALTQRNLQRYNELPNVPPISEFDSLETALTFLQPMYRQFITEALHKANVQPEGAERSGDYFTPQIESILNYFGSDMTNAVNEFRT